MGSVNAIAQSLISVRALGRGSSIVTGDSIFRSESKELTTPVASRTAAELGTQPDVDVASRGTVSTGPEERVDQTSNSLLHSRPGARYIPTAAIEEEIALKAITQRGVVNTGNRQVVRSSDLDSGLIAREE